LTDNADDKAARLEIEKRRKAELDVIRSIMMTKAGRAWIWNWLDKCHIFGSTFFGEETHRSAFAQGQENVGRILWLDVQEASLDQYVKMVQEQKEEERRLAKVREEDAKAQASREDPFFADNEQAMQPIDLPPPE